jgi:hypothetical protein
MYLSNIAAIGREVLTQALGLQKSLENDVVLNSFSFTPNTRDCQNCDWYEDAMNTDTLSPEEHYFIRKHCDSCPTTAYYKKKLGQNLTPRLPKNSLKLFLLYHFLDPDQYGTLSDLSSLDLAEIMGCAPQTVINSNSKLIKYGYVIEGLSFYPRCLTLCLDKYHRYLERNRYGENGYIILTKDILLKLMKLPVNALRLALRAYLELDSNAQKALQTGKTFTFKELQYYLPNYCHPNIVKKTLEYLKDIFNVSISTHSTDIIISEEQNPHQTIEKEKQKALKELKTSYFWQKNASDEDREEFLNLAIECSYQSVKDAFTYFQKYKVQTNYLGYWLRNFIRNPIPVHT